MNALILIALVFRWDYSQPETIQDMAALLNAVEDVKIECEYDGRCSVTGNEKEFIKRSMVERIGPELREKGWHGHIRIEKQGT